MSFLKMTSDIIKKILAIFREELLTRSLLLLLEIIEKENSRIPFIGIAGAFILCVFRYMPTSLFLFASKRPCYLSHTKCKCDNIVIIHSFYYFRGLAL